MTASRISRGVSVAENTSNQTSAAMAVHSVAEVTSSHMSPGVSVAENTSNQTSLGMSAAENASNQTAVGMSIAEHTSNQMSAGVSVAKSTSNQTSAGESVSKIASNQMSAGGSVTKTASNPSSGQIKLGALKINTRPVSSESFTPSNVVQCIDFRSDPTATPVDTPLKQPQLVKAHCQVSQTPTSFVHSVSFVDLNPSLPSFPLNPSPLPMPDHLADSIFATVASDFAKVREISLI